MKMKYSINLLLALIVKGGFGRKTVPTTGRFFYVDVEHYKTLHDSKVVLKMETTSGDQESYPLFINPEEVSLALFDDECSAKDCEVPKKYKKTLSKNGQASEAGEVTDLADWTYLFDRRRGGLTAFTLGGVYDRDQFSLQFNKYSRQTTFDT